MEVHVINDLLWGSCAKRLFTEYYAKVWQPDAIITNGMPNSGGYDSKNIKWSTLPIGYPCKLMIAPGAVIDRDNLKTEMGNLPFGSEVIIHENAGVIVPQDFESEKDLLRIGSTMTGGAAAVKRKMDRDKSLTSIAKQCMPKTHSTREWLDELRGCNKVLVLCAQGHGLSINFGMWPYTTSRNTSPAQAVADAGLPPQAVTKIIGCMRPHPIRVSNRYDELGEQVGFSGPCFPDQEEISWEDLKVPSEITSVSKKVRRVFTHSPEQLRQAVAITGTTDIFLGFLNYLPIGDQMSFTDQVNAICGVSWVGLNKTTDDIYTIHDYNWDRSWV